MWHYTAGKDNGVFGIENTQLLVKDVETLLEKKEPINTKVSIQ